LTVPTLLPCLSTTCVPNGTSIFASSLAVLFRQRTPHERSACLQKASSDQRARSIGNSHSLCHRPPHPPHTLQLPSPQCSRWRRPERFMLVPPAKRMPRREAPHNQHVHVGRRLVEQKDYFPIARKTLPRVRCTRRATASWLSALARASRISCTDCTGPSLRPEKPLRLQPPPSSAACPDRAMPSGEPLWPAAAACGESRQ